MHAIRDVGGAELRWVKPKWSKLQFELRAGEAVVATLAWASGSQAVGQWGYAQYRFSRAGWLRPRILVWGASTAAPDATDAPEELTEPVASFGYRSGALTFPDGRVFFWKKPKRWTTERIWVDSAATVLARCRPAHWRSQGAVMMAPEATALPELPLLLLLGQYYLVLAAQEADAASTAATVAIIASS